MEGQTKRDRQIPIAIGILLAYFALRFGVYFWVPESAVLEATSWLLLAIPVGYAAIQFHEIGGALSVLLAVAGNVAIRGTLGVTSNLTSATLWVSFGGSLLGGVLIGYVARITMAIRRQNERLLTTMREANHRIKNSLALARSVASLERNTIEGSQATEALDKVVSRIDAIATLHDELLWRREDRTVDLSRYLHRIVEQLRSLLGIEITDGFQEAQELPVDSNVAVQIALITNELLTNIAKHDTGDSRLPRASISLSGEPQHLILQVASDSGSLPEEPMTPESGLGTRIVDLLVEQIHGSLTITSREPPAFKLSVPLR